MLKILYAASNNINALIQLNRFLKAIDKKSYTVKIAAYKISSPNIHVDWTLDCLLNMFKPESISLENDNLKLYFEQVKSYNPDIIISDLEYFTSYIASQLDITLWQYSSSLLQFSLQNNYNISLFSKYAYLLNKSPVNVQRILNIIENSNCNLVCSHLGDSGEQIKLKNNFEWVRPYHTVGRIYKPCRHDMTAVSLTNSQALRYVHEYNDSVIFGDYSLDNFNHIKLKSLEDEDYYCNIRNSELFLCEGHASILSDAFYNEKHSFVTLDYNDANCIINSVINEKLGLSTIVTNQNMINSKPSIKVTNDNNIKYLHERLNEL